MITRGIVCASTLDVPIVRLAKCATESREDAKTSDLDAMMRKLITESGRACSDEGDPMMLFQLGVSWQYLPHKSMSTNYTVGDVVCRTNSTPTSDGFTGQNAAATASTSTDAGSIPDAGQLANIAPTGIAPPAAGGSQSLYFENVLMTIATLPNPSDNNHAAVIALREEVQKLKERNDAQRNDMAEQRATIEKQQTVIVQQQERIDLHDSALNNLKQHVEQGNDTIKRLTERLQAFEDHVAWRLRTGGDSEPVVDPQQLQNRDWE